MVTGEHRALTGQLVGRSSHFNIYLAFLKLITIEEPFHQNSHFAYFGPVAQFLISLCMLVLTLVLILYKSSF